MVEISTLGLAGFAALAPSFSKAVVDTFITPKLNDYARDKKTEDAVVNHSFESKFSDYLVRAADKQFYIRTIVFQNQQKPLDQLYLPLTVTYTGENNSLCRTVIDSYCDDFIPKHHRVLLTDTAGMGKSTMLRFLFLKCIAENKAVPIFIELRQLSKEKKILDLICNELNSIEKEFDKDFILALISRGDFVFFLDGFDEIPFSERDSVTTDVQDFISKASSNDFILTSRPETALSSFSDFKQFKIQPLSVKEAFEVIRLYDQFDPTHTTSTNLINELTGNLMKSVKDFLTNPLLVSLLYMAYQFKPTVPLKKSAFYRQVYDALFEFHDLTKPGNLKREKHSGLDVDDFNSVLRALGNRDS